MSDEHETYREMPGSVGGQPVSAAASVTVRTTAPIGTTAQDVLDQLHRDRASGAIPDGARVMIMGPREG